MPKSIFLSYSTDDTATVVTIREHLEAEGVACWMAPRDIVPGLDYAEQIIDAIEQADVLVLVLTESSNRSTYVRNEVERAVAKGKVIIPFRLQNIVPSRSLEFFISNHQWVEAWDAPLTQGVVALTNALSRHLALTPTPEAQIQSSPRKPANAHNLPHQLTAFIGRDAEVAALDDLLAKPDVRLITILGPGGMGKTRLSLAVAERHLADPRFANGVYFVSLAPVSDVQHMVPTVAEALSFSMQSGGETRTPQQQLLDYLHTKEMLVVFDNFEHLLDGAELVAQILHAAPHVRVIATSRERLRVPGEHLFSLQGLDYGRPIHYTDAGESAAAQLFLQSARQLQPDLALNNDEMAQVARICRLVGGMPLGIELAAAWSEVLSPAEIAAEIERNVDFLEAEQRGGQEHHRSIRAVFDSTWHRLDAVEQTVFARLSIFRGGFTREAAERVAGASLRWMSNLVGKSLIQHDRQRGRYTLHELLRQLAEEKLHTISDAWEETLDHHCTYYCSFLQQQEADLKGRRQSVATTAIEDDIDNVRLAWEWAVSHCKVGEIERSHESLYVYYWLKTWLSEGEVAFRQAALALEMVEPTGQQGFVYAHVLASQAFMQGRLRSEMEEQISTNEIIALLEKSYSILCNLGVQHATGGILVGLSNYAYEARNEKLAERLLQEAETIYVETSDHWNMASLMEWLGSLANRRGDYEQAKEYYQRGIAISKEHGMLWKLGGILNILGEVYRALGQYTEAKEIALAGLEARQAAKDKRGVAYSLYLLGDLAWRTGDLEEAKQRSQQSLVLFQELGLRWGGDFALHNLGNIACTEKKYAEAKGHFFAILAPRLAADTLDSDRTADAFTGLATVLVAEGRTNEAVELLQLAIQNQKAWQETRERATRLLAELLSPMQEQGETLVRKPEVVVAELLCEQVNEL